MVDHKDEKEGINKRQNRQNLLYQRVMRGEREGETEDGFLFLVSRYGWWCDQTFLRKPDGCAQ